MNKANVVRAACVAALVLGLLALGGHLRAAVPLPRLNFGISAATSPKDVALSLQVLLLLTVLTLAPAILILMTSFTRIVVVLSFLRQALGTQTIPSNQVLIGLSLFLTFFTMSPVIQQIDKNAVTPYMADKISQAQAWDRCIQPMRDFMFRQTRQKDLALFVLVSKTPRPRTQADVPTLVLIPAFVTSELKTAFEMGFIIYLPFLVIDMVVSSVLMSMGMLMLPPVTISLPFKILLFIMIDGWHLIVRSLITSFH